MGYRSKPCCSRNRKRTLAGIGCVLAGILILIWFLPDWLFAILAAGVLLWCGASLVGGAR